MHLFKRVGKFRLLALMAALAAGILAVSLSFGSSHREAPRDDARPLRGRHRRLRLHGRRRPRRAHGRGELDPLRGPGRRAELLPVRRPRRLLHQRGQHGRRQVRRPLQVRVQDQLPEQELVPVRPARRDVAERPQAPGPADLPGHAGDLPERRGCAPRRSSRATCRSRRTTSARRPSRTTTRSPTRRSRACRGGGKVFAGQRDDPFFVDLGDDVRRHQPPQAAPATRAAARTTWRATTSTRSSCRCPRPTSPATASPSPAAGAPTPSSASGRAPSARASGQGSTVSGRHTRTARAATSGQPPRQPAHQRGHHPDRAQGQVQRHPAGRRRRELRHVRRQAGAGARSSTPCSSLGVKENNRTDIVHGAPRPASRA